MERTDRDRLIELLKSPLPHFQNDVAFWHDEHIGEFADHLLANGVIVPPCKVGQKVYTKGHGNAKQPKEWEVFGIWNSADPKYSYIHICWHKDKDNFGSRHIDFDDIGKTVFLTREEAEKFLNAKA